MSNGRRFRRNLAVNKQARQEAKPPFPWGGPSLSTVRRHMRQLEAEGTIEAKGKERTGKPGRPATLYGMTAEGKRRARERDWTPAQLTDMITKAIHDRKHKHIGYMFRLLEMKDPDQAERVAASIAALVPDAVMDMSADSGLRSRLRSEALGALESDGHAQGIAAGPGWRARRDSNPQPSDP